MLTVRPKVAELVFQLYGRPLHPELFQVYESRSVTRENYQAKIDITHAGHVVTWRSGGMTLTEVAAARAPSFAGKSAADVVCSPRAKVRPHELPRRRAGTR